MARNKIRNDKQIPAYVHDFYKEIGFLPRETFIDAVRLRAVTPGFHLLEKAKSVSFIHRDGWYANPAGQINVWIPVFPVESNRTFGIYRQYLHKPIENNSRLFDLQDWNMHGGFQSSDKEAEIGKIFPSPRNDPDRDTAFKVTANGGEAVFFAGDHLHGTLPNTSVLTRYTLEIRTITLEILSKNMGIPNVDNRSAGSTLHDFKELESQSSPPAHLIARYVRKFAWDKS